MTIVGCFVIFCFLFFKSAVSCQVFLVDDEGGGICHLLPTNSMDSLLTTCPQDPLLDGQHLRVLAIEVDNFLKPFKNLI